jgi:hypothetical protein
MAILHPSSFLVTPSHADDITSATELQTLSSLQSPLCLHHHSTTKTHAPEKEAVQETWAELLG